MKTVVALPGEGIGPEVVDATCELLMGTGLPLKILTPPQGPPLPEETKRAAREADGVLFGAAGPRTSAVVSWLRWEMAAWAGVRPIRFFPGMRSPLADPAGIDYVLLRENSEGLYPGREGDLAQVVKLVRVPVFGQHADTVQAGAHTGWILSLIHISEPTRH